MVEKRNCYNLSQLAIMLGFKNTEEGRNAAKSLLERCDIHGIPRIHNKQIRYYSLEEIVKKMAWGVKDVEDYNLDELSTLNTVLEELEDVKSRLSALELALSIAGDSGA